MVTSIGSASAPQAAYAPTPNKTTEPASTLDAAAGTDTPEAASAPAQSAESAASARLGEQLAADADAARVQRAAGGAAPATAATSSETTATDYIAEADTNSDKTVSDAEQAAYDAKLRAQADQAAQVRAAYGVEDGAAPALVDEGHNHSFDAIRR